MVINNIKHQVYLSIFYLINSINIRIWFLTYADREAISEYEVKVKELRKQSDDVVN